MKKLVLLLLTATLVLCLCACGSSQESQPPVTSAEAASAMEAPAITEAQSAVEAPAVAAAPAIAAPSIEEPPETEDPLKYVRFDWKPTEEESNELYQYALPYIQNQPYFVFAEFLYGNNYIVHVNCNPEQLDDSIIPFMQAVRDKFYELRKDEHDIIYILFMDDSGNNPWPVSYSVEDVP